MRTPEEIKAMMDVVAGQIDKVEEDGDDDTSLQSIYDTLQWALNDTGTVPDERITDWFPDEESDKDES